MTGTVAQIVEILRASKSARTALARIAERLPQATPADIAQAMGIVGGVDLDHAALREPATKFRKPVQRRCEACRQVFPASTSAETVCPGCAGRAAA